MPRLSKSSFLKGRQCARRIWLAAHDEPEPELESDDIWELREAEGARVEALAAELFPGASRVVDAHDDEAFEESRPELAELVARTRRELARGVPVLQAHFEHGDLLAIADVVEPRHKGWFLWEVKASTSHKPVFDWDLAFQVEVARQCGLDVVGAGVIRLNKDYVRGRELDLQRLLVFEERTKPVFGLLDAVRAAILAHRDVLTAESVPDARPSSRCKSHRDAADGGRPSTCGHLDRSGYCGSRLPEHWIGALPDLRNAKSALPTQVDPPAIEALDPDDVAHAWTPLQARMIRAVKARSAVIDVAALRAQLDRLVFPVAYVDFEFDPGVAVPRFEGTRPYSKLPFQWSMHVQAAPGAPLEARAPFLHLDGTDPRRAFAETLLAALPETGSLVAHHASTEKEVVRALAGVVGAPMDARLRALDGRFVDTIEVLKAGYYHPAQHGSYSIKKVAPALLGRGYDDLALQNGMAAVVAWKEAIEPDTAPARRAELERDLRAYCGRDTELMHEILERVRELVASGAP
ncbi:MAG: DUF2779 domain-containing protein [Planctomycetes bacterium]|nr:DUF2779 domain-containing protein [Planctomycetota bacterium]